MNSLFANAQFGQMFITRDGHKAVYLWANKREGHSLIVEGNPGKKPYHYDNDGKFYGSATDTKDDIVRKIELGGGLNKEIKQLTDEQIAEIAAKNINDCEETCICVKCDHCTEYWSALEAVHILRKQEGGEDGE